MIRPEQITIPFAINPQMSRENLCISASNADVVKLIDDWPHWAGPIAIISGPEGSGKSHSAYAWAEVAQAAIWSLDDLAKWSPEEGLPQCIAIDHVDMGPYQNLEVQFFHLINALKACDGFLWLTSKTPLAQWNVTLPDLKSRLLTAVQVSLKAPDDALLSAVITKLFSDRQMAILPQNVQYLVTHMDRSLANARWLVERIDEEALRKKSKITRNIIANILAGTASH